LSKKLFFTTSTLEKIAAFREQFRHVGNENMERWMVSGEMGKQKIFQNSQKQCETVELGLGVEP